MNPDTSVGASCWRYQPVAFTRWNAAPYARQSSPPLAGIQSESSSPGAAHEAFWQSPARSFQAP